MIMNMLSAKELLELEDTEIVDKVMEYTKWDMNQNDKQSQRLARDWELAVIRIMGKRRYVKSRISIINAKNRKRVL